MPTGFQLFGPSGDLWADSNLMPAALIKSGYLQPGQNSISVSAYSPVVFFRTVGGNAPSIPGHYYNPDNAVRLESLTVSGSTWTFLMEARVNAAAGGQVIYYIFDSRVTNYGNAGLQVWDESGRLTFNSNHSPLRVVSSIRSVNEWTDPYIVGSFTSIALPSVAAFSLATYRRGFVYQNDGGGGFTVAYFYKSYAGIPSTVNGVFVTGVYINEVGAVGSAAEDSFSHQGIPMLTIADVSRCPVPFG